MEKLKRLLWLAGCLVVIAFVAMGMAAMWIVGQMPR